MKNFTLLSLMLASALASSSIGHAQDVDDFDIDAEMSNQRQIEVKSSTVEGPTSNQVSEPRFDWSKHKGEDRVPHPNVEKGLIRITKDKVYLYGTKSSEQNRATSFRFGYFDPINLENPETAGQPNSTFEENYDETSNPALLFDYEWQLLRFGIGKAGIKLGTGIYFAQGNGHFENPNAAGGESPRERFSLLVFPNSLGAIARFQAWDNQLLVPYADGGLTAFAFTEMRDDDQGPKFGGSLATYWAVGGQLNISRFDALSRVQLDREYGINTIYLVGEYRNIIAISEKFDFSSELINGGFLLEF